MGKLEGVSSTGDFGKWMKEALAMECYCLKGLSVEGLWDGFLFWGPWMVH